MTIGGVSIVLIVGVVNFLLLAFQLASGRRWIKVPISVHRKTGLTLVITGTIHGILGVLANL
jgi:hypothetical protein